ncbi:glycoside hydrolase, catalytic domain-containing protein [Tanacetum coccineum]
MVTTRNTTLEGYIDEGVMNWVTEHDKDVLMAKSLADAFSLSNLQEATLAVVRLRNTPMYALEISPYEGEYEIENTKSQDVGTTEFEDMGHELLVSECYPKISLNALSMIPTFNTMIVKGNVEIHLLHLLFETGSTHNFYMIYGFKWKIQGQVFSADVMFLPLGGCEMVLAYSMVVYTGTIEWNFQDFVMKFVYEGKKLCLGGTKQLELQWMSGKNMSKQMSGKGGIYMPSLIFDDVFVVPSSLPPQRIFDHMIPLKDESIVVNIRPYRYPPNQEDVIIAMINELMELEQLDKNTIKNKFPIAVIEELIDELHGAKVFSKLDLRFGYHQIRICEEDIFKTTFKYHDGHYEFVGMPFGLTNAPSTFRSLMNSVFSLALDKRVSDVVRLLHQLKELW